MKPDMNEPTNAKADAGTPEISDADMVKILDAFANDPLCGCGYRQSLHHVDGYDGRAYCLIARLRHERTSEMAEKLEADVIAESVLTTLMERMEWYRAGCDGLEDRPGYYASGDCARDAARDLEAAISEIRVLGAVISKLRKDPRTSAE